MILPKNIRINWNSTYYMLSECLSYRPAVQLTTGMKLPMYYTNNNE